MDHHLLDDGGTGKKMGLARLAKSCSSSSSVNSLSSVEKMKNKNDSNDVEEDRKLQEFSMNFHHSSPGSRVVVKQSGTVTLLPSKVNVVSYSGYQLCENMNTRTGINESLRSFESVGQSLPCSDPDFQLTPKEENITSYVTLQSVEGDKSHSPDIGHHSHLPQQIKRSNSMTRLSEVMNQIHNLCMFPAQPLPVKEMLVTGAGGVLLQESEDGILHPVSYTYSKFKTHQLSYGTIEKELLSLVLALQKYECYLQGASVFLVYTDHNPLIFLVHTKAHSQSLLRWALYLQNFNLHIKHLKGNGNIFVDAVSCAHSQPSQEMEGAQLWSSHSV